MSEEKTDKTDVYELKTFLENLPSKDLNPVCNDLIELVKTNRIIFRNWRLGLTRVPLLERTLMNQYSMQMYGKEIFKLPEK